VYLVTKTGADCRLQWQPFCSLYRNKMPSENAHKCQWDGLHCCAEESTENTPTFVLENITNSTGRSLQTWETRIEREARIQILSVRQIYKRIIKKSIYVTSVFCYDIVTVPCFYFHSFLLKCHFCSLVPTNGYISNLLEYFFLNYCIPILFFYSFPFVVTLSIANV
jgi:hypothetical protein